METIRLIKYLSMLSILSVVDETRNNQNRKSNANPVFSDSDWHPFSSALLSIYKGGAEFQDGSLLRFSRS